EGEDVDADEAEAVSAAAEVALDDRGDLPAGAAEGDVVGERDAGGGRGDDLGGALGAEEAGGAGVAVARLGIERLHAGEERGGDGEADEEGGELERVAAPVAEEGGQGRTEGRDHARVPPRRVARASASAARRGLWVTRRRLAPVAATSSRRRAMTASPVASSRLPVGSSARRRPGRGARARP